MADERGRELSARNSVMPRAEAREQAVSGMKFTAVFMKVPEGYIGLVEELPGANTQGKTLEDAKANLQEAILMTLEANRVLAEESLAEMPEDVIRESIIV